VSHWTQNHAKQALNWPFFWPDEVGLVQDKQKEVETKKKKRKSAPEAEEAPKKATKRTRQQQKGPASSPTRKAAASSPQQPRRQTRSSKRSDGQARPKIKDPELELETLTGLVDNLNGILSVTQHHVHSFHNDGLCVLRATKKFKTLTARIYTAVHDEVEKLRAQVSNMIEKLTQRQGYDGKVIFNNFRQDNRRVVFEVCSRAHNCAKLHRYTQLLP